MTDREKIAGIIGSEIERRSSDDYFFDRETYLEMADAVLAALGLGPEGDMVVVPRELVTSTA